MFSCGVAGVDRLLPTGGLRHGMLVEWIGKARGVEQQASRIEERRKIGGGSSAATLGLLSAREACREGGVLVVVDRSQTFYPPAAAAWGVDLERLIIVRPQNVRDELWAAVQALRSPVVAALWARIERLDSRAFRRLQLAAEAGRTLGVLVRPASARGQPSWADVRLEISPLSVVRSPWPMMKMQRTTGNGQRASPHRRRVSVHVLHCHPGRAGGSATLEIDDAAYIVQEAKHDYRASPAGYRPNLLADG